MKLGWSVSDDSESHPVREIHRNCGQLLGKLDDLLPFLYIADYGASGRDLRARMTETTPGLFVVGARTGGNRPGVAPRLGLILPLRFCRDEKMRMALEEIPSLIGELKNTSISERRHAVQAKLDEAFGGDLRLEKNEDPNGFFALKPGPGLFRKLHATFDYVTELVDNPADTVHVSGINRFHWRTYGELMEWFHGLRKDDRYGAWSVLTPFYVFGDTGALPSYNTRRWARAGLRTPAEEPSRWFVIRPGLPDAPLNIKLEMCEYGWAKLHLSIGTDTVTIHLSNVYDPFDELVAWSQEIDEGDLPIQMEIDEEGAESILTVLRTDNPGRVLLRVAQDNLDNIQLEGIVSRTALASALKSELLRFFTTEFAPKHWDASDDDDPQEHLDVDDGGSSEDDDESANTYVQTRERVLNHPWLAK